MPRTANGLWAELISFENLYRGYLGARKGKRYHGDVMRYAANVETNIINLQNHLLWKSWQPGPIREFVVREPKMRAIKAPAFADRVLHHALVQVVEPLFEPKFIYDSYACRKGKGTQAAVARVQHFLRVAQRNWGRNLYVVQADISRYFASIRHDVLMTEIEKVVSDPDVIWLWRTLLAGYGFDDGVGRPVGALSSQLEANITLNRLDHIAKDRMGLRFYARYMDDFVAILPSKQAAQEALREMGEVVNSLGLSLNPKTCIYPYQRGIDFSGYRIWPTHILPRKRNIKRARKDFKRLARRYAEGRIDLPRVRERVMSFLAYTKHCSAEETANRVLGDLRFVRDGKSTPKTGDSGETAGS